MDEIEVFKGTQGWYWRRVAPNGRIVAIGGEAFTRRWSAKRAARRPNRDLLWRWA